MPENLANKNKQSTREIRIIKVLIVKAGEEESENLFTPIAVSAANIRAIGTKSNIEFIEKRAAYLFDLLPDALKYVTSISGLKSSWIKTILFISFITGLLSNYLGPTKSIHVVYNPLTILLSWNVLIYLFIATQSLWKIRLPKVPKIKLHTQNDTQPEGANNQDKHKKISSNFFVNWIFGGLLKSLLQLKARYANKQTKVLILKKILPAFWNAYKDVAGKALALRFKSLTSFSSIGLVTGALLGIYLRGLFFKYNIVWESTFISEPETIRTFLNILFGPASLLYSGRFITTNDVMSLTEPLGTSAAPWIHIMAITTLLYVFVPRILLASFYAMKAKRSLRNINLAQPYFSENILKDRASLVELVREGLKEIISKKIDKTGKTISSFVIRDYFDKIIVPILISFREKGGKIKELEKSLFDSQQQFEPMLLNYLQEVQEDFKDSVLTEINLFLGRNLDIDIKTIGSYQPSSNKIDQQLPEEIANDIGDTISGTFVTTMALAVGSISGGIGKSLGIAIISGILGVSGPVGLLIGGIITAATLGGLYKMRRDKISGMIKDIPLPHVIASMTLSDSKIEKTREETYAHTENEIRKILDPKIDELTDSVLKDITF
jgi:hypothetical protein